MTELLDRWNRDHAELHAENPRALSPDHQKSDQAQPRRCNDPEVAAGRRLLRQTTNRWPRAAHGRRLSPALAPRARARSHVGTIQANVEASVKPPRVDQGEKIRILDQDQIERTLRHWRAAPCRPIVALALAFGARHCELLALDLNVDAGTLRVDRSLEQTKGRLRFKSPKTKRGRRTISLPPAIVAGLRAHLLRQQSAAWRSALAAQRPRIPCLRVTMVACARRTGSRKN